MAAASHASASFSESAGNRDPANMVSVSMARAASVFNVRDAVDWKLVSKT